MYLIKGQFSYLFVQISLFTLSDSMYPWNLQYEHQSGPKLMVLKPPASAFWY